MSILFLTAAFTACVQVDDDTDDPNVPEPEEAVVFEVAIVKMAALDIKDAEADALEVYGNITAKLIRGNVTETNTLWDTNGESYLSVGVSDVPMTESVTYTVEAANIASSMLEVRADLSEHDFGEDNAPEDLGNEAIMTPLKDITTSVEYDIVLNKSGGQEMKVTYSITRLP
ncbi:MAG: hypothetical protein AAGJ93_06845 [Bacteroidota bacterium]